MLGGDCSHGPPPGIPAKGTFKWGFNLQNCDNSPRMIEQLCPLAPRKGRDPKPPKLPFLILPCPLWGGVKG